jgi:hypothetical protein
MSEYDLTEKQTFYLYLSVKLPELGIIDRLWASYQEDRDKEIQEYYQQVSPFNHPCGDDSIFPTIISSIDPEMFMYYYRKRGGYLISFKLIGDPWFICQFNRTKEVLESTPHYYTTVINEHQRKLSTIEKARVLDRVIYSLIPYHSISSLMDYLYTRYTMYKNMKLLYAYPLAVDCEGELCRFE